MVYEVELSSQATRDIQDIYAYTCEHGPADPDDWKSGLDKKLASLEMFPEGCGLAPEDRFTEEAVRQTLYGPFRILFTIREQKVYVLTVRHAARRFIGKGQIEGY